MFIAQDLAGRPERISAQEINPALRGVTSAIKGLGFGDQAAAAGVQHAVLDQGFLLSSLDLFYFFGWMTLILIVCWLVRRPAATAAVAGEG